MGLLLFRDGEALARIARHALSAPSHRRTFGQSGPVYPAFWLVHDDGVYLMSNGEPFDPAAPLVAYAEGCDPAASPDTYYDASRALVGGDDFVELIELERGVLEALGGGGHELRIHVSPGELTVDVFDVRPRRG